ncbi:MAG: glycosyltransferase family 2 protein [Patescibacteria group bacterium]|nr:glycosyltransferase family 2 protein [Patescibacteria group bacterium]
MKIFCIIPALNEEKTIGEVVMKVRPLVDEVVLVDDGSIDNTKEIAAAAGAIVLEHHLNRGQGAALETGNQYALARGAEIIFHFDADGQFSAADIPSILAPLISGQADVVFGSRFLEKKSKLPFLKEKFFMPIARLVNLLLFGVVLTDPQSGFRAATSSAWRKIKINQDGMAHCSEIIAKVFKNKLRVVEAPITVRYDDFGQNFGGGVRIIKDLLLAKIME